MQKNRKAGARPGIIYLCEMVLLGLGGIDSLGDEPFCPASKYFDIYDGFVCDSSFEKFVMIISGMFVPVRSDRIEQEYIHVRRGAYDFIIVMVIPSPTD